MIVNLGHGVALNPDHVVSVRRDFYENYLLITDVHGAVHEVPRGYGEDIYDAEKRVIKLLSPADHSTGGAV